MLPIRRTETGVVRALLAYTVLALTGNARAEVQPSRIESVAVPGWARPVVGQWLTGAQNASGVPLGGLGTGFMEVRPDGRIHDSCLSNDWLKPRPPMLFRLSASLGAGNEARTFTLMSGKDDMAVPAPARYLGHFPAAELDFTRAATAPAVFWVRAFSPFVPADSDLSNIPAALFTVVVRNAAAAPLRVRLDLRFALPGGGDTPPEPFRVAAGAGIQVGTGRASGYAIAASGTGWDIKADSPPSTYGDPSAHGAASAQVDAGEERQITFVVSWFAPRWITSDGKVVRNRYAVRFADARGAATFALERSAVIQQRIEQWQREIYTRPIPDWLKDGLINSLYSLTRNSIWLDDGRFLVNESFTGRPVTESVAARFNASWALLQHFPAEEKQVIRAVAKLQAENGEIPFGLGAPVGLETAMFGAQRPILSTQFALMCWRDYERTRDLEFLVGVYPRLKRAIQFSMSLDTDNDGLINESPGSETGFPSNQFYDRWPWFGTSSYTAGIGLAALRAGEEAAKRCGDAEFAKWCRERLDRGVDAYEGLLWTGDYYRLYADPDGFRQSDTCLADQLCGPTVAWLSGLGDILPGNHTASSARSVARLNKHGLAGYTSGVKGNGEPDESGGAQSRDVVLAETFNAAAAILWAAGRRDDAALQKETLDRLERMFDRLAAEGRTWDQPFILSAKDGSPVEGHHYTGNLSIWAVERALSAKP